MYFSPNKKSSKEKFGIGALTKNPRTEGIDTIRLQATKAENRGQVIGIDSYSIINQSKNLTFVCPKTRAIAMLYTVRNSDCYTYYCDSSEETKKEALEFLGLFKTNRAASGERAGLNEASPLMANREFY